jgi:hypothetical protein
VESDLDRLLDQLRDFQLVDSQDDHGR